MYFPWSASPTHHWPLKSGGNTLTNSPKSLTRSISGSGTSSTALITCCFFKKKINQSLQKSTWSRSQWRGTNTGHTRTPEHRPFLALFIKPPWPCPSPVCHYRLHLIPLAWTHFIIISLMVLILMIARQGTLSISFNVFSSLHSCVNTCCTIHPSIGFDKLCK